VKVALPAVHKKPLFRGFCRQARRRRLNNTVPPVTPGAISANRAARIQARTAIAQQIRVGGGGCSVFSGKKPSVFKERKKKAGQCTYGHKIFNTTATNQDQLN
jgi:hypothetical protein